MKIRTLVAAMLIAASVVVPAQPVDGAGAARPWFGMSVRSFRTQNQRLLHVERVVAKGPAERAGIRPDDLIVSIGSPPLTFADDLDLLLYLAKQAPGAKLSFDIVRAGKHQLCVLVIGTLPEAARADWDRAIALAERNPATNGHLDLLSLMFATKTGRSTQASV